MGDFIANLLDPQSGGFLPLLVAVFAAIGLWSTLARHRPGPALAGGVKNLFLGARISLPGSQQEAAGEFIGHVLALAPRSATFVSPRFFGRGEKVVLSLAGLPAPLAAEAIGTRVTGRQPESYLVTVSFKALSPELHGPLMSYIRLLASQSRYSHA